jgi:hypothetical protein
MSVAYRLSVEQYLRMGRAGILTPEHRVEMLDGRLVEKMIKNPPHIDAVYRMFDALTQALPAGWTVNKEDPLVTPESVPEPACVVLRGDRAEYATRLPIAADAALVVEVADSSLQQDRVDKRRIYAGGAIPAYWIVNIPAGRIEVYTDPTGPLAGPDEPDYRVRHDHGEDDHLPLVNDGREIARLPVRDLLPAVVGGA